MINLQFKNLGNTKTKISSIGQGTGTGFKKIDRKRDLYLIHVLQKALDFGINFIDTAEIYFNGHSETIIGNALKKNRNNAFVATKFLPEHCSYKELLKAAEGSLRRLQIDYIDLYQVHWPNPVIPIEETLRALEKLIKDGKIKHIGVCNFSLRQLIDIKRLSKLPIASLQTEYNLMERSIEKDLIPYCEKNKITVIAYTPLNSGNILKTEKYSKLFSDLSKKYNKTTSQIILNFLISYSPVIAIPSTTSILHLEENAKSTDFALEEIDIKLLTNTFTTKIINIDTARIKVATIVDHTAYKTIDEALNNKLKFFPSPKILSQDLQKGDFLKPVKVRKLKERNGAFQYQLLNGRIRYWAWVIAFEGKKPIPAIIEN